LGFLEFLRTDYWSRGRVGVRVKIIAVVGTGSGCGKTTVACRILRAIPGLGAVKISPREGASRVEWGAGEPGKDTDLYLANGAVRVARIIGPRESVVATWELVKGQFDGCQGVLIEGTSVLDVQGERFVVFVDGAIENVVRQERKREIVAISDIVLTSSSHLDVKSCAELIDKFLRGSANG
jgi:molybdopterin-guanine dinucleotide biosynthesis protein